MSDKIISRELILKTPESGAFFKNYSFSSLDNPENKEEIFITLEILNASFEKANEISKGIFDTLKKYYFLMPETSAYDRFEESLKQINIAIKNKIGTGEKAARINAILGAFSGNELNVSQTGYAQAYLLRGESFMTISEGLYDNQDEDIFQNIASGELEKNDKIIFTTENVVRFVSNTEITKIFSLDNLEESLTELRDIFTLEGVENINVYTHTFQDVQTTPIKNKSSLIPSPITAKIQQTSRLLDEYGVSRNAVLGVIAALIFVLIVSIWALGSGRKSAVDGKVLEQTIKEIQVKIDDANRLALIGKKEVAAQTLNRAESNVKEILSQNPGEYQEALASILERIVEQRDIIDEIKRISTDNTTILADLAGKRTDVNARGLINSNDDRKYVYDQNALYETILSEVKDPLTIEQSANLIDGANFSDFDDLVFLNENGGIIESANGISQFASTKDENWKPGIAIDTYSRYLYLLDPNQGENGQIWKYERTRSGYQSAVEYSKDGDLKTAVDITIDGSVWILKSDGSFEKLFKGERQDILVEDPPSTPMDNPTRIFTGIDLKNIYALDPVNKRVIKYFKDVNNPNLLIYDEQYLYDTMKLDVRDIYVSLDEQKLYLLTKDKIYESIM